MDATAFQSVHLEKKNERHGEVRGGKEMTQWEYGVWSMEWEYASDRKMEGCFLLPTGPRQLFSVRREEGREEESSADGA